MPTILAFEANPDDTSRLKLDVEIRAINDVTYPNGLLDYKLVHIRASSIFDIQKNLQDHNPEIFHFSGHGSKDGALIFQDFYGGSKPVSTITLAKIIKNCASNLKCIVLNCCYSSEQAKVLSELVPYVIGNKIAVEDELASLFSRSFYQALAYSNTIESSFEVAQAIVSNNYNDEKSNLPELLINSKLKPKDSRLFVEPIIQAEFRINKKNKLIKENTDDGVYAYDVYVWIEHIPHGVRYITFDFFHEEVAEEYRFFSISNLNLNERAEKQLYGNVQIRASLWFEDKGVGIITNLYDALIRRYKDLNINEEVEEALISIQNH